MNKWRVDLHVGDIVAAVLLIIFAVVGIYITTTWIPPVLPGDPGAAFFPRIALVIIIVFSTLLLAQRFLAGRRRQTAEASDDGIITVDVAAFMTAFVLSVALVAGITYIGFEPAAFVFLFVLVGWRTGRWVMALVTAVISVAVLYLIFVPLLNVRLPLLFLSPYLELNLF